MRPSASTGPIAIGNGWANRCLISLPKNAVFQDYSEAVWTARDRDLALRARTEAFVPQWSLAGLGAATRCLRGLDMISATTILAEVGDISRFETAPQERLCKRDRHLTYRGKKPTVAVTTIARELSGFIRALGQKIRPLGLPDPARSGPIRPDQEHQRERRYRLGSCAGSPKDKRC